MPSAAGAASREPRVLYLLQRFPPAFGGGAQFLRLVRDRILGEGFEALVLTGNRWIPGGDQPGVYRLPSLRGQAFPRLDAYSFTLLAAPALLALRSRFDILHTMGNAHYVYEAILAGRLLGKPVIVSSVQNRSDDPGGIAQERFGTLKNALFSRASAYICCSGLQVQEYRKAGYPTERVHFIPNGADPARFHPCGSRGEKEALRERLGLPRDGFVVVTVGAIIERKGIDLLVEAWIRFRKPAGRGVLALVGPSRPGDAGAEIEVDFVQGLHHRLAAAGLEGSVIFTGRVGNVEEYLRAADVFALMSRGEGFPVAILEAMDSGLPFVIWDLGDYAGYDLRNGEQGFLVPAFDVERLARCFADLESSPERVGALGRRARDLASRFTIDSSLQRHVDLYRKIALQHASSPSPARPGEEGRP